MGNPPGQIELPSRTGEGARIAIPSPRVEHFDGEIPPALSPLDAFAAQGRLLAKQLDESMRRDRRLSRLPPSSVARSLSRPRPGYFRSPSSAGSHATKSPDHGSSPEVEEPRFRPQSEHPRLSGVPNLEALKDGEDNDQTPMKVPTDSNDGADYFSQTRSESPAEDMSIRSTDGTHGLAVRGAFGDSASGPSRESSMESFSRSSAFPSLAPPVSPYRRPHSSSRSTHMESSDDDYTSSNAGSTFSKPRKMSSSSAMSMPHSPMSPYPRTHPRSPSLSSEASNTAPHLPRPSFNFSRPMSRSSTSLSAPSPVGAEAPHGALNRENRPGPIMLPEDDRPSSSYVYSKYALPRGRSVSRNSTVFSGLQTPHFEWQEPLFESSPPPSAGSNPPRFYQSRSRSPSPTPAREASLKAPERSLKASSVHGSPARNLENAQNASKPPPRLSADLPRSEAHADTSTGEDREDAKSTSAGSASTLRPQTGKSAASSHHLTAEEHLAKGIQCHQDGSLKESTYHLRIAAMQNHPTAMLMYALACRHGWGMRPNQREGVQWLRKAVDSAGLEVIDDSAASTTAKMKDIADQKTHRAQFALSIYELGVSHLNGWGIEQDKALALRCFEIAGHWGDADALAEAGFCYAEGVGCKKDLKKAAKFYRMAEAKGMNIVGNSWIYKDKYMSDDESTPKGRGRNARDTSDKKPRNKSRTRSIFGRKKSVPA
ncbi:hypothetical protein DTO166G4_3532 [Paecilomyces variotii]|uniref:Putative cell cycle inhibitor Nif1 n=1 Tax=Byssochlamys spectabilis TaxID=264951 RepID=A0A443HSY3_BYSSP|nr:putative cell cycle inhibitor Nif1 [Paecilomyces variotii]KAJ9199792.1 hypothetical protein DTO032I3_4924 [Paecilomyces variotii]KAJ9207869.1 hypothetical protein DTO164E3_155 [Paecilomyces variotii]KAJ9214940.1 hypothetical protein DTO166G4_3532 [Paecilomyces variotii]KAJ9238380.1 hypothetical protein DTO166G5_2928 [Paecilomyces variotii]KAJ9246163.1 hypothetical protein DTO169E5_287 [Paecilomyces variotii]